MGSRHALSNGNEPEEVTDLVAAFEAQNKCRITLSCFLELHKGYLDLKWTAMATYLSGGDAGPLNFGCVSVSVWAGDYKTLMGLVSRLLYALDFQIALNEFGAIGKPSA